MTTFINTTSSNFVVNWKTWLDAKISLQRDIKTYDEYGAWVREWKQTHKALVEDIKFCRVTKNRLKAAGDHSGVSQVQSLKVGSLRGLANSLYEMRAENKANLKNGAFPKKELVEA